MFRSVESKWPPLLHLFLKNRRNSFIPCTAKKEFKRDSLFLTESLDNKVVLRLMERGVGMNLQETEYCNLELMLNKYELYDYIRTQDEHFRRMEVAESSRNLILFIKKENEIVRLNFRKFSHAVKLMGEYRLYEKNMNSILEGLITKCSGSAVVKHMNANGIGIKRYIMGELVEFSEIRGARKIVHFKTEPPIRTPNYDVELETSTAINEHLVTHIEINNLLTALQDALKLGDDDTIHLIKKELEKNRKKLLRLEFI